MSLGDIRVLVIDDDPDLTGVVCAGLEKRGYAAIAANSGEHGLELAFTQHPQLILLDVMMPGMDGYQVCRELQFGFTKDIPVVFLTAKADLANMMEANRAGASAYVTKPFRMDDLLATVGDVLRDASVYYDEITGLPTLASVQVEVQRRLLDHTQLGILYVTLDGVHAVEQLRGFEAVDGVFQALGERLLASRGHLIRDEDYVSVSSLGNAFLVVLSPSRDKAGVSDADLHFVKERLEHELADRLGDDLDDDIVEQIGVYVGCARLSVSPKVRFKRALLEAIERATQGIEHERSQIQQALVAELDRVIAGEQVSCVYQPIVRLDDFSVLGYELLARGPLASALHRADALFEVARAENRLPELDRLCRCTAARAAATLPTDCLCFINAEPVALFSRSRNDFDIKEFVEATPPEMRGRTVMEITENSVIDDFDHMRNVVRQLRDHGFRVAIDDAGAGYAGLQTMVEIEPDFIKLDMSLTRGIDHSVVKQKLVGTLRDFCRQAEIALVAEGVETAAQLDALKRLGITYGQGYLFARPGSPYPLQSCVAPKAPGDAPSATAGLPHGDGARAPVRQLPEAGAPA